MQKLLRARENHKRGPFSLAGGVQVHIWEDWLAVVPQGHQFADGERSFEMRWWNKTEFAEAFEARLRSGKAMNEAPFWVTFPPEQNARNVLIAAGKDVSWPILTSNTEYPVISAFKLLKRWRDADLRLHIAPLW